MRLCVFQVCSPVLTGTRSPSLKKEEGAVWAQRPHLLTQTLIYPSEDLPSTQTCEKDRASQRWIPQTITVLGRVDHFIKVGMSSVFELLRMVQSSAFLPEVIWLTNMHFGVIIFIFFSLNTLEREREDDDKDRPVCLEAIRVKFMTLQLTERTRCICVIQEATFPQWTQSWRLNDVLSVRTVFAVGSSMVQFVFE